MDVEILISIPQRSDLNITATNMYKIVLYISIPQRSDLNWSSSSLPSPRNPISIPQRSDLNYIIIFCFSSSDCNFNPSKVWFELKMVVHDRVDLKVFQSLKGLIWTSWIMFLKSSYPTISIPQRSDLNHLAADIPGLGLTISIPQRSDLNNIQNDKTKFTGDDFNPSKVWFELWKQRVWEANLWYFNPSKVWFEQKW